MSIWCGENYCLVLISPCQMTIRSGARWMRYIEFYSSFIGDKVIVGENMRAFRPIFGSAVFNSLNADKPTKGMNNWQSCNPFSPHSEVGTITSLMWLQKTSQPGEVYLKLNPAPLNQNQFLIYTFSPLATELTKDDSLRTAQNYKLEVCFFLLPILIPIKYEWDFW